MEKMIQNLAAAGVEVAKIERARHRGLAYLCLRCLERDGTRTINIKCRLEEHLMHMHLGKDNWPFYCKLCGFKCRKYDELTTHLTGYSRHLVRAAKEKIVDHRPYLVENPRPHVFGPADYKALTPEASLIHFLGLGDMQGQVEGEGQPSQMQPTQDTLPATTEVIQRPRLSSTPRVGQSLKRSSPQTNVMPPALGIPVAVTPPQPSIPVQQMPPVQGQWMCVGQDGQILWVPPTQTTTQLVQPSPQPLFNRGPQAGYAQQNVPDQRVVVMNGSAGGMQGQSSGLSLGGACNSGDAGYAQSPPTVFGEPIPAVVQQGAASQEVYTVQNGYGLDTRVPEYTPTPIKDTHQQETEDAVQSVDDRKEQEPEVETRDREAVLEDVLDLEDDNMSFSSPVKRGREGEELGQGSSKRSRGQDEGRDQNFSNSMNEEEEKEENAETNAELGEERVKVDTENGQNGNTSADRGKERANADLEKGESSGTSSKRDEEKGLQVNIKELCEKTMLSIVERSEKVVEDNRVMAEKTLKAMTEGTRVLSKLVDAVNQLEKTMRDFDRREEHREEARRELERTREAEWRKALSRLREEELKWEDRRREMERQDRRDREEREDRKKEMERQDRQDKRDRDDKRDREEREDKKKEMERQDKQDRRDRDDKRDREGQEDKKKEQERKERQERRDREEREERRKKDEGKRSEDDRKSRSKSASGSRSEGSKKGSDRQKKE